MSALESMFGSMSLADLARFTNSTVGQIVEAAFSGRSPSPSKGKTGTKALKTKASAPKASAPKMAKPGKVPRGGLSLDQALAALRSVGERAKLEDVRVRTGGTVPQVRAALQKLAGSKKVKITGQRRGTRYTAN